MKENIETRRVVGKYQDTSPLKRAFRLRTMLIELRGERLENNGNIRKLVGRTKSK